MQTGISRHARDEEKLDRQLILLVQGNTGGALAVRRSLDTGGCRAAIDIAEMDNYPYSCWRLGPARIRPIVTKRGLQIGEEYREDVVSS